MEVSEKWTWNEVAEIKNKKAQRWNSKLWVDSSAPRHCMFNTSNLKLQHITSHLSSAPLTRRQNCNTSNLIWSLLLSQRPYFNTSNLIWSLLLCHVPLATACESFRALVWHPEQLEHVKSHLICSPHPKLLLAHLKPHSDHKCLANKNSPMPPNCLDLQTRKNKRCFCHLSLRKTVHLLQVKCHPSLTQLKTHMNCNKAVMSCPRTQSCLHKHACARVHFQHSWLSSANCDLNCKTQWLPAADPKQCLSSGLPNRPQCTYPKSHPK